MASREIGLSCIQTLQNYYPDAGMLPVKKNPLVMSLSIAGALVSASPTSSADRDLPRQPTSGIAYNTKERSAVTYECSTVAGNQMHCRFVQTAVRKKLGVSDLQSEVDKLDESTRDWKPSSKDCAESAGLYAQLQSESSAALPTLHPKDREVAIEAVRAMEAACKTGSTAALRDYGKRSLVRDTKVCRISSHIFEQDFSRLPESKNEHPVWVTSAAPSGPCGIVQLSRFEPADMSEGFWAWNYIARKAVTNPDGDFGLLGKCRNLDEESYTYSWRSDEGVSAWAECDQIEFSAF
ncbi:MAG: hypothetical protein QM696_08645 [Steroidobacteraceae bacterium]